MKRDKEPESKAPEEILVRPTKSMRRRLKAVVLVPFIVSLFLPAVTGDIDGPNTTAIGLQALLMGYIGNPIAWLANVLLPIGFSRFKAGRMKPAREVGIGAVTCAGIPLVWSQGLELEVGYYVWFASIVLFLGGLVVCERRIRKEDPA